MEKRKQSVRARGQGRSVLEIFFCFYALLAEHFPLRIRRVRGQGTRRSTRMFVTVHTAFTVLLFKAETIFVAF